MEPTTGPHPALARSPAPGGAARERRWSSRVVPQGGSRYALFLTGSLHAGWAGRLAAGLAARHVSVVRAAARRTDTLWTAEIEFDVLEAGVEPSAVDFIALMLDAAPDRSAPDPRIASFHLSRGARDVAVELRARDEVGFLSGTLRVFAFFGLFPHSLRVDTVGGEVRDLFRLQGLSGQVPPAGVVAALERRLAGMVEPA